jgi:hypothetical protein
MIHFKKDVAYVKMANAIHDFIYPTSLNNFKEEDTVLLTDIYDFPQSKSLTKFVELRKQLMKVPLYVLETKPTLVKRYLISVEHLYTYLKKVQKKNNDETNSLVEKLFLLDTIIDEKNDKVIFTNYSVISLLMNYLVKENNEKYKDAIVNFLNGGLDDEFYFYKDGNKYKLTRVYNDKYIFGIGVRV